MKVEILEREEGAQEAARRGDVTVVIDAIRCCATTVTALALGAEGVVPVLSEEEARRFVGQPKHRVAGERQGQKCAGFDHGNSPNELKLAQEALLGQTLVLSTSNGTKMVNLAREGAAALFMGTTLNARAVARSAFLMAQAMGKDIVLVAAGEYGAHAEEDACAARCIARHLHALGATVPADALRDEDTYAVFNATPSADELRELGYEADIAYCAQRDLYDLAPMLVDNRFVPFRQEILTAVA